LTPGSLLVQQASINPIGTGIIVDYTKSGTASATSATSGFFDLPENLTVLGGNLFVSDGSGRVNRMNLATGAVTSSFSVGAVGLNGLGTYNGNLLTLNFSSTAISVYSVAGVLLQSIALASHPSSLDWNGIASDGTAFYLADSPSGRLYEYATTGAFLGFLQTDAVGGLAGVSYDSANNSLWIANSSANRVEDLSINGAILSQFSTGTFRPGSGIAVVPVNVPEPGCWELLAVALAFSFVLKTRSAVRS
jgi:hypothetical protein